MTGALIGLTGAIVNGMYTGKIDWANVASSTVTGAVAGVATDLCGWCSESMWAAMAAGFAGSALTDLGTQLIDNGGQWQNIRWDEFFLEGAYGAGTCALGYGVINGPMGAGASTKQANAFGVVFVGGPATGFDPTQWLLNRIKSRFK